MNHTYVSSNEDMPFLQGSFMLMGNSGSALHILHHTIHMLRR